jgi:arginyl-tRNA synthetase
VDVQNYIDNTGVQVADVVVGLMHLERLTLEDVRALMASLGERAVRIDFYCWDLYARVSQWYEALDVDADTRERRRRREGRFASTRCTSLKRAATTRRRLPTWSRRRCCGGIWRRCSGWTSTTISAARERHPAAALLGLGL